MEYLTFKFENTQSGLSQKDAKSRELSKGGWTVVSEQIEKGHIRGDQQCCFALICLPLIFAAGRTPSTITVTYGRDLNAIASRAFATGYAFCMNCGTSHPPETNFCIWCGKPLSKPAPQLLAPMKRTKACPFCAEQILEDAKKCRFCGEFLETNRQGEVDA